MILSDITRQYERRPWVTLCSHHPLLWLHKTLKGGRGGFLGLNWETERKTSVVHLSQLYKLVIVNYYTLWRVCRRRCTHMFLNPVRNHVTYSLSSIKNVTNISCGLQLQMTGIVTLLQVWVSESLQRAEHLQSTLTTAVTSCSLLRHHCPTSGWQIYTSAFSTQRVIVFPLLTLGKCCPFPHATRCQRFPKWLWISWLIMCLWGMTLQVSTPS